MLRIDNRQPTNNGRLRPLPLDPPPTQGRPERGLTLDWRLKDRVRQLIEQENIKVGGHGPPDMVVCVQMNGCLSGEVQMGKLRLVQELIDSWVNRCVHQCLKHRCITKHRSRPHAAWEGVMMRHCLDMHLRTLVRTYTHAHTHPHTHARMHAQAQASVHAFVRSCAHACALTSLCTPVNPA